MREFNLNNGTCWIALSYAMDEARAKGMRRGGMPIYHYVTARAPEIYEQLMNKTYKFSVAEDIYAPFIAEGM